MNVEVTGRTMGGTIRVSESKSHAHRLLICAALSGMETQVQCKNSSQDIDATARCLDALCAKITRTEAGFLVSKGENPGNGTLFCGESGSTYRFLLPVACALGGTYNFILEGKLPERPMEPLMDNLEAHGITISGKGEPKVRAEGKLTGGTFTIPGNVSSQYISGLLFALPILKEDSELQIEGELQSKGYITMTLSAIRQFGVTIEETERGFHIPGGQKYSAPQELFVEGDWSNAAFWLCLGALSETPVVCTGLNPESQQGDKKVLTILKQFGAGVEVSGDAVTVTKRKLRGITIDAGDIPDLVPILSLVGAGAEGVTEIVNAARLRLKESDRLFSVSETIRNLGGTIEEKEDGLIIEGVGLLKGGPVSSFNDHRIAMTAAIGAAICKAPVVITQAQAVNKSYPGFYEDYKTLGGVVFTKEETL